MINNDYRKEPLKEKRRKDVKLTIYTICSNYWIIY